jgi:hypothetical protein
MPLIEGKRIIVVLDTVSSSKQESVERFGSSIESVKSLLSDGDMIEVYGGPGASMAQYEKIHAENDAFWREYGPFTLSSPSSAVQSEQLTGSVAATATDHSLAIFTNDDPSIRTVQAISAHMSGINIGTSQNLYSAFLVNGVTNVSRYFLQSGQLYYGQPYQQNGTAKHVWTDTSHGLNPIWFNLPYQINHEYVYDVTYMGSPGVWWLGAEDYGTGSFDYFIEYNGQGSQLIRDRGTSVFFENASTNANWWYGFPVYVTAYHAREWNGSQWINWTQGHVSIVYASSPQEYPNNGKISGTLVNDQTALWDLTLLLLAR